MPWVVRGDNIWALASGLSYVQVDKHAITIYATYIRVDLVHHEIFRAKVGKGGMNKIVSNFIYRAFFYLLPKKKQKTNNLFISRLR